MPNPPEEFFRDRTQLADWIAHNPTVPIAGHGVMAPAADFQGLSLRGADLTAATLDDARFDDCDLSGVIFKTTRLHGSIFRAAEISGATFELAKLEGANFSGVKRAVSIDFRGARLKDSCMEGVRLEKANFHGAYLEGARARGAKLAYSDLTGVNLRRADLRGAILYGAELTNSTWGEVRLDKDTNLDKTVWRPEHDAPNDRSDSLRLTRSQTALSWNAIRFLGEIPLFGGASLLLILTLLFVSGVQWLNTNPFVLAFEYPIPVPLASRLLLLGSVLLTLGSLVFQVACPPLVKEYSRVRWVQELGRPGVLHTWAGLRRPGAAAFTMVLLSVGGAVTGYVFLERLLEAIKFVIGSFT